MARYFALAALALVAVPSLFAGDVDTLFDATILHNVSITMSASDWATLRATYQANTNYDATVTIDGERVTNSSIRSRGSGTRNGVKPGLRVDFARRDRSQRFRGFKILVLDNMYNDASFLREQLSFALFREMGVRVPRESYARLTVNGEYWGLYAIVEPIDDVFVSRHFDAGGGNLFEYNVPPAPVPGQLLAWDFSLSRGETIGAYVPSPFEPKTNEDTLDGSALLALLRTISQTPDATFVEEVSQFIDPRAVLTHYAVEVATSEVDGLTSFFGVNNFYLYQLQGRQQFVFIPWDHDFGFTNVHHNIYFGIDRNRLIRRLLNDETLLEFYRQTLASIIDRYMNPGWMTPRIDAHLALITASVQEDRKRRGGADNPTAIVTFEDAVAYIRTVVAGRAASVEANLNPERRRAVRR